MKPTYESPLASRYASKTMLHLFSPDMRYETWRRLWVALARAEHTLGLPITQAQVDELAAHVSPIDYDVVAAREKEVRHDVMAHIYAYGLDAPGASLVLLLFGAAYLYFFGVPKWVNITLLGLACVKLLLDWMFTVWYRRQY